MRLSTLLQGLFSVESNLDCEINGLSLDSRQIKPNHLFVALKGSVSDGKTFIENALAQGASAVLVEAESPADSIYFQQQKPILPIIQLRKQLSEIASRFYDNPSKKLKIFGVTGTNGKTSCTHFFAQCLAAYHAENACGIIGTLGYGFPHQTLKDMGLTTPDAVRLQAILHAFNAQGAEATAMEVSSHSIDQNRVEGVHFEIGMFTNLSQDHLDYHGDMDTYAAVKKRFLTEFPLKNVIINADDVSGEKWIQEFTNTNSNSLFIYGTKKTHHQHPGIFADHIEVSNQGISANVHTPWGAGMLQTQLLGAFNLSNLLGVLTALNLYGIPFKQTLELLREVKPVPGRMQRLGGNGRPTVIVDYSHTPDALSKVLQALRIHTEGQLFCVFGCGGNRDQAKRPLMAQIAERYADSVIVTTDNPRYETPEVIVAEIMRGFIHPETITIELDRSKAIEKSIQWAKPGDCVLIAGKGAEHYQQIGAEKKPFDDVEEVLKYLRYL